MNLGHEHHVGPSEHLAHDIGAERIEALQQDVQPSTTGQTGSNAFGVPDSNVGRCASSAGSQQGPSSFDHRSIGRTRRESTARHRVGDDQRFA